MSATAEFFTSADQLTTALRVNADLLAQHDTDTLTIQQLQTALNTANADRRALRDTLADAHTQIESLHAQAAEVTTLHEMETP